MFCTQVKRSTNGYHRVLFVAGILSLLLTIVVAVDELGVHGAPWFGWWDANFTITGPYTLTITPNSQGAASRGGLRNGDRIDLRAQTLQARIALNYQPMALVPTTLRVGHGDIQRTLAVTGSTVWDGTSFWKLQPMISRLLANLVLTACALFLAVRVSWDKDARTIAAVCVLLVGIMIDPGFFVVPWASVSLLCVLISRSCATVAAVILIRLSATFGLPSGIDRAIQAIAYTLAFIAFSVDVFVVVGLATTKIDPLPGILSVSPSRSILDLAMWAFVSLSAAAAAVYGRHDQPKRLFLLPLPLGVLISGICFALPAVVHHWTVNVAIIGLANTAVPLGAAVTTILVVANLRYTTSSDPMRRQHAAGYVRQL